MAKDTIAALRKDNNDIVDLNHRLTSTNLELDQNVAGASAFT
jgi:hypothetical protein